MPAPASTVLKALLPYWLPRSDAQLHRQFESVRGACPHRHAQLLAQIIVAKYCDHLPLYRREQIYATRHGIAIPRQSMARWLGLAADWLRPIYDMSTSTPA